MFHDNNLRLSSLIISWYLDNKRDLPWRKTKDPYIIWLSEVILQQTRVNQGYNYFVKFVTNYPSIDYLANAPEDEVLKLWQGLGYYSRARNLHAAAKNIVNNYNGVFPIDYNDVLSLNGVGEYTAAAIVSFAYDLPYAVLDGNVYRVLSRVFGIDTPIDSTQGKKIFRELADQLLDKSRPGLHNQAIMEFGALQCVPVSPDCAICPLTDFCVACAKDKVKDYPVKRGRTKVRNRYFHYFDVRLDDFTFVRKRTDNDIWKNLYEFPMIETDENIDTETLLKRDDFIGLFNQSGMKSISHIVTMKHVLSHQVIHASFYKILITSDKIKNVDKIHSDTLNDYPVSRLIHRYIDEMM